MNFALEMCNDEFSLKHALAAAAAAAVAAATIITTTTTTLLFLQVPLPLSCHY